MVMLSSSRDMREEKKPGALKGKVKSQVDKSSVLHMNYSSSNQLI